MNPVILPPGRARLSTKPLPTGSETTTNTMGIVPASRPSAATTGVLLASSTSGWSSHQFLGQHLHMSGLASGPAIIDQNVASRAPSRALSVLARTP